MWQTKYGHPVFALETFVDPQRFQGTCYRAAGWEPLGLTAGCRRIRRDFYDQSGRPKQLFVKLLRRDAAQLLCAPELPTAWQKYECKVLARSPVKTEHSRSLWEAFAQIGEFRKARGRRHPLPSVLACAACGVLAGAEGIAEMAEIVAGMEQRQLRALRCYRRRATGRYEPPSESTLRRALSGLAAEQFDTVVAQWVSQHEDVAAVALDGKALKGCLNEEGKPLFLVSAVAHGTGAFQGQVQVDSKSNEIPAARVLLKQMGPLDGIMVTTDAAHTQIETSQIVVMEQGGDYLSPIKGNQPSLLKKARRLLPVGLFFPTISLVEKQSGRVETRQLQVLDVSAEQMGFPFAKQLLLLRRHRRYLDDGHEEEGFLYLLCSRSSARCTADDLLTLCRGHWIIESSIHYCRDVLYHEDRCRIRDTTAARVLATLQSLATYLLGKNRRCRRDTRRRKHKRINRNPGIAVRMVTQSP